MMDKWALLSIAAARTDGAATRRQGRLKEAHQRISNGPRRDDAIALDLPRGRKNPGSAPTEPLGPIAFNAMALVTPGLWPRGTV